MADAPLTGTTAYDPSPSLLERTRPYRAVLASRMRSQRSYRLNFSIDLLSSLVVGFVELAEVWLLFHNAPVIGGLTFHQVLLVFGIGDLAWSIASMVFGHVDNLADYVRRGTLDVFYLRPQPLLLQLVTSDISLRRLTRAVVGLGAIVIGLRLNEIQWSPTHVGLLALTLAMAVVTYAGTYVWAAGVQFFVLSGAELTNSVVYGGRYAATQVAAVWSTPLKVLFGYVFPMAMTAYVPTLLLLGLPGPPLLPTWLGWCTPLFATWMWLFGMGMWRSGVRHYQGGGG